MRSQNQAGSDSSQPADSELARQGMSSDSMSWPRCLAAALIGLAGSLLIWIVTPYSNFIIGNSLISDHYLPVTALFLLLILILAVNPLLGRFWRRRRIDHGQLAIITAVWLMASVPASSGLLRYLPYHIAYRTVDISVGKWSAEYMAEADLPETLYLDTMGFREPTPVASAFVGTLKPGESIPWGGWLPTLATWGPMVIFWWMLMIGLAGLVFPQWRRNERLAFPLVTIYNALIERPEKGTLLPSVMRTRGFWAAAGVVFLLYLMLGLNTYDSARFPAIPLKWNLNRYFAEEPFRYLPTYIKTGRVFFVFVGVAFFMSNRTAFSIWFFALAYGVYQVVVSIHMPPFDSRMVEDHRTGAMLVLTFAIIWLGRAHWARVWKAVTFSSREREDSYHRFAFWLFALGVAGMLVWLVAVKVQWWFALFIVFMAFVYAVIMTRIVAEAGLALFGFTVNHIMDLTRQIPVKWVGVPSAYFAGFFSGFLALTSRVHATTMATHALALNEDRSPRFRKGLLGAFIGIAVLAVLICGAVHLACSYHYNSTLNGEVTPINWHGMDAIKADDALSEKMAKEGGEVWQGGIWNRLDYNQPKHIVFGAVLAGALQWACIAMPRWPLHPVGLLVVYTWSAEQFWVSIFIGWCLKTLLVRYGGARLYSRARSIVLGLIMGEVIAAVFWCLIPAVLALMGRNYTIVNVLPT